MSEDKEEEERGRGIFSIIRGRIDEMRSTVGGAAGAAKDFYQGLKELKVDEVEISFEATGKMSLPDIIGLLALGRSPIEGKGEIKIKLRHRV
jgi:hypothetical protein